jgi:hypothetical protein
LNIPGNKFSYNSTFSGSLSITNKSAEYLIISKNGLFKGQVRVDAVVSGDIEQSFNNHISLTTIPSKPLMPERSIIIPLDLFSGELKKLLLNHPQANLDIEFTVYIDPVTAADGSVINSTSYVAPIKTVIKRPGINITEKYLQNRLNAASRGKQGQKIDTAQLFAGLIAEEQSLLRGEVKYRMVNAKGMSNLLKSALIQNLEDYDWIVQVETLCSIMDLPVDYEFMNAISANLNSDKWPVRMTALYILANNQGAGFDKVLDWTVKYDPDFMVQEMAVALGAIRPEVQQPAGEPNMPSTTPNQP